MPLALLALAWQLPSRPQQQHRAPTVPACFARSVRLLSDSDDQDSCSTDRRCIYFVSGNRIKSEEVDAIMATSDLPVQIIHIDIDLPELQGDPMSIAKAKAATAARRVGGSVIVEDTSLCFGALNGMPGPYIKSFFEAIGVEGLYQLIEHQVRAESTRAGALPHTTRATIWQHTRARALRTTTLTAPALTVQEDKSASCECVLGFSAGPGAEPLLFRGKTEGRAVSPRGTGGAGLG